MFIVWFFINLVVFFCFRKRNYGIKFIGDVDFIKFLKIDNRDLSVKKRIDNY